MGCAPRNIGYRRQRVRSPGRPWTSWEAQRTRHKATVDGHDLWFLSAETIAVFKLLFFRVKDRADLQRLVAVRPGLDAAKVRRHLVEMMGAEDERVAFWDTLLDELD